VAAPAHEGGAVAAAEPWGGGGLARRHPELQPIAVGIKAADPVVGAAAAAHQAVLEGVETGADREAVAPQPPVDHGIAAAAEKGVVGIAAPHDRGALGSAMHGGGARAGVAAGEIHDRGPPLPGKMTPLHPMFSGMATSPFSAMKSERACP